MSLMPRTVALMALLLAGLARAGALDHPFVLVPQDLRPDNFELTIPGMSIPVPKVNSTPWGLGGKCGDDCLRFAGPAMGQGGGLLSFPNLRLSTAGAPGSFAVTSAVWTCGVDDDGNGKPCSGPVDIYLTDGGNDPIKYTPWVNSPLYLAVAVPEPAVWALWLAGLGLVALRRQGSICSRQRMAL